MAKQKISVFFVIDGEKLEAQACLLAASLKKHLSADVERIAYHRQDYVVSEFAASFMEKCGIDLRPMDGTDQNSPNPWAREWPVGNKMFAKAQHRDCDISVYLDTDMILRTDLAFENELGDADVLACVADYMFGSLSKPEDWEKIYAHFGLPLPQERVRLLAGRKLEVPPYFNGGLAIFREGYVGEAKEHFGRAWLKDCLEIEHAKGFDAEREGLDQTLYPITINRLGIDVVQGRQALNFNVQAHGLPSNSEVAIAHYHTFGVIFRRVPQIGYEAISNIIEIFGTDLTRAFIDRYRRVLEWNRPRFIVPKLIEERLSGGPGREPNLSELAVKYGSDKGPFKHRYTELYQMLFWPYIGRDINFLEMGLLIGGPEHGIDKDRETRDCPSIRMWLEFFTKAKIHGLDVSDFSWFKDPRFEFFRCDMETQKEIATVAERMPTMDIIMDDASHASHHQQNAFLELFPRLKSGGLYVIEDLRWQPPGMEKANITKTAELFYGFQVDRVFKHQDADVQAQFSKLADDISGCFVYQEGYDKRKRDQVVVIHKK